MTIGKQLKDHALSDREVDRLQKYIEDVRGICESGHSGSIRDLVHFSLRSRQLIRSVLIKAVERDRELLLSLSSTVKHVDEVQKDLVGKIKAELDTLKSNSLLFGLDTPEAFRAVIDATENPDPADTFFGGKKLFRRSRSIAQFSFLNSTPSASATTQRLTTMLAADYCPCWRHYIFRHERLSNCFAQFMSLLLSSSGAKRQVFNITNALGITKSYDATKKTISKLESNVKKFTQERSREVLNAIAYDNRDLSLRVSEQGNGAKSQFISITTAISILSLVYILVMILPNYLGTHI